MTYEELGFGPGGFWTPSQPPQEPCSSVMQKLQRLHFDVRALQNGPWAMGGRAKGVIENGLFIPSAWLFLPDKCVHNIIPNITQ